MTEFYLNQDSLAIFAQLMLSLAITLYLLSLKGKSTPTRLLIAFFAIYTLLLFIIFMILVPPVFVLAIYFEGLSFFIALLVGIPMLQFAYRFPSFSPQLRREATIVFWLSVLAAFIGLGLTLDFFYRGQAMNIVILNLLMIVRFLSYGRFVPREFLHFLEKEDIIDLNLGDQVQREMTILFSDVRSFTSRSEGKPPKENFDFINTLLNEVGPIIRKHNGFIDKYIGDAIMALFPEQAAAAVQAGIAMLKRMAQLNAGRQAQGQADVKIGVGLHTGNLMLGTIGEHRRMDTTVISDAVNLASRMEGLTKRYGAGLLISEQTFDHLADPDQYHIRFVDKVQVKGKQTAVDVYEVFDGDDRETIHLKDETKSAFEQGVSYYYEEEFQVAQSRMAQVLARNSQDKVALLYMQRATQYAEQGVPIDWDGVTKMAEK